MTHVACALSPMVVNYIQVSYHDIAMDRTLWNDHTNRMIQQHLNWHLSCTTGNKDENIHTLPLVTL